MLGLWPGPTSAHYLMQKPGNDLSNKLQTNHTMNNMTILLKANGKGKKHCVRVAPSIPIVKPTKKEPSKEECHMHKLCHVPVQADLPTHKLSAPHFSESACEECLTFPKNFKKVTTGQSIASGKNKCALKTAQGRFLPLKMDSYRRNDINLAIITFKQYSQSKSEEAAKNAAPYKIKPEYQAMNICV